MSDYEQAHGGRSLRMVKKKDGPNWLMIAGGAIVMAVSVSFGRRKILKESEKAKERASNTSAKAQASSPHYQDLDETGLAHMYETVHNGTAFWDKSESVVASQSEFEVVSYKTKRPAPNDPSPQVSKFCRQLSQNSVCQSNEDLVQSDPHNSTALRVSHTVRREMVHRLRQHIRSRDAMIYDMQTQPAEQDQMISMHRNHYVELQQCMETISTKLYGANLEVQRLHRELIAQRDQPVSVLSEERADVVIGDIKRKCLHHKDVEGIIYEAGKLNEELERLQNEKEANDSLAQAKSQQCEILSKKVSTLVTELEEVKSEVLEKQRLLEAKEQENLKLASFLQELQHKLVTETRENDRARGSTLSKRTDACSTKSGRKLNQDIDQSLFLTNNDGVLSTCVGFVDGNSHQAGKLRRLNGSIRTRNGLQQRSESSGARKESLCVPDYPTKQCEATTDEDVTLSDHENSERIDESAILKFEQEVDQLAAALAVTSKVVSEKIQVANRVLEDFQKSVWIDSQPNRSLSQIRLREREGAELPLVLSCLFENLSAEQELSHKFKQVSKPKDIEKDMKELAEHQVKLAELKSVVAKATPRDNAKDTEDGASTLNIEQKLAVQDDIVQETSLIVQQLSSSFQLLSPHSPPVQNKQEIWRTVRETSGSPASNSVFKKRVAAFESPDLDSSDFPDTVNRRNSPLISERQNPASALRHLTPNSSYAEKRLSSPTRPLEKPYQFQLGAFDGQVSTSRGRRSAPVGASRTSFRKTAMNYENTVGSKRQSNCVDEPSEEIHHKASFRPDSEATCSFSFGVSSTDWPLANLDTSGICYHSENTESGVQKLEAIVERAQASDQGDRMSSPEPEPLTHMYSEQHLSTSNTSEPSVNPTFFKRFRSSSGSRTSTTFNCMHSLAYDVDRYSPSSQAGIPRSSCDSKFEDEEARPRKPFYRSTSSPLAASSSSCLDGSATEMRRLFKNTESECEETCGSTDVDKVEIKRPTEEHVFSGRSYNSNPDCSPRSRMSSATPSRSPVGVSPFAARMAYLEVR
ncbi:uncharacterized protein [Physcomitrium patens]|uniref:uncharacterized protein isoform X3 n=1 Tax=Physcomitrium patens TaxID=3218 RepID=UPI000D151463|nr:uncharacterized protein LOC112288651 isoform X3 [Physcomitrium patens]|eukprot:XP_024388846.1 uncharacterized protein LOC112288651 isoform X3 [Physcomitrella patens]